ncbi:MAG: amino acid ABC transporter substrate-binding protein [Gaiellaceae bacterium]
MRVFQGWTLCVLFSVVLFLGAGCSLGDDDDDSGNGDASGDTGQTEAGGQGDGGGNLLQEVQDRGTLRCGVNDAVPGFGFTGEGGEPEGFDIDFCKVIAAAVLGDAEAVEYTPLSAEQRFTALQSGEIDVLSRNTTYTASRDGTEGARFLHTTFYDGQGMMVRTDSGHTALEDLAGETICVLSGTTTELNLESQFQARGIDYTPLAFEDNEPLQAAFVEERCGAWTSDKSQLAGIRSAWPEGQGGPEALTIMDETMSKEPLGPVVADGDDAWADAVNWAIYATIQAEEFGLTSDNIAEGSEDPEIQRFLGEAVEGEPFDAGLGLPDDFAVQIVTQVGNYGEIYERNVGEGSALELPRDINALWTDGGLQYAPPYR